MAIIEHDFNITIRDTLILVNLLIKYVLNDKVINISNIQCIIIKFSILSKNPNILISFKTIYAG